MVIITKSGQGLRVSTALMLTVFSHPTVVGSPSSSALTYRDERVNLIEISQGSTQVVLPIADISTIGGNPPAPTVAGVVSQLAALTA